MFYYHLGFHTNQQMKHSTRHMDHGFYPRGLGLWPSSDPTREVIPGHGARSVEIPDPTTRFWCPNIWFSSRSLSVPDFFGCFLGFGVFDILI